MRTSASLENAIGMLHSHLFMNSAEYVVYLFWLITNGHKPRHYRMSHIPSHGYSLVVVLHV